MIRLPSNPSVPAARRWPIERPTVRRWSDRLWQGIIGLFHVLVGLLLAIAWSPWSTAIYAALVLGIRVVRRRRADGRPTPRALRFTRICDNLPPGTPRIDRPDEPGGGPG